jgi:hypothetical protein
MRGSGESDGEQQFVTDRLQAFMIGNGALVLIVGMLSGFVLMFHLLGEVTVSPLPWSLAVQIPGSEHGWRAAHIGNITNGLLVVAVGASLQRLVLGAAAERWVAWGLIYTAWGNACFYVFGALAANHGLSLGTNRLGEGDVFGVLAYLPALVAALVVLIALAYVAQGAFARALQKQPLTPRSVVET